MTRWRTWIDVAVFEAAWFGCIELVVHGLPLAAVALIAAYVVAQLACSTNRRADLILVGVACAVGTVWDTTMMRTGVIAFASPGPWDGLAPAWILALWAQFAVVLRGPLRALWGRPWLVAALGLVGGPAAYAGACRMGAGVLAPGPMPLVAIGAGWALIAPALVVLARRLS